MSAETPELPLKSTNELASERTDWALSRTRLASERSLMAVVRTSLSLISFGFTIYKFFQAVRETLGDKSPIHQSGPWRLGLALTSLGMFMLIVGALQHWKFLQTLKEHPKHRFPISVSLVAAIILLLIGTVTFVTIFERM